MFRRLAAALVVLNISLFAVAVSGSVDGVLDAIKGDCWKDDGEERYCCANCCWFIHNCAETV